MKSVEGWWNAAHDEQVFINRIDVDTAFAGKSAAARVEMVASIYIEAGRRGGGDARHAVGPELPTASGSVACSYSVVEAEHAHNLSCGFATEATQAVITIEYTVYREISDADFVRRAQAFETKLAAALTAK